MNWKRLAMVCTAFILVAAMLTACGGGDDDDGGGGSGDIPVPSGADELADEDVPSEDLAADVDISGGRAIAYSLSDSSIDDVADFYNSGVEDDGWTVDEHAALGGFVLTVMHQDDDIVVVTAMDVATAREQGGFGLGEVDVDLDELADDDILIIAASMTCNEDSVDTCIEAMDLGI